MQIVKTDSSNPKKSKYGDFELIPEDGWKIRQTFIDFESGLLIASVSIIDRAKWINNGFNGMLIPTQEYKIDLKNLSILKPDEWQKYFDYNEREEISEDKKLKLISKRVFEPERNSDGYQEELFDLDSGKRISSGKSIAFSSDKRVTLLENHLHSIKEKEEQQRALDAKPTLQQFYLEQLDQLKSGDIVLCYHDNLNVYRLTYQGNEFALSRSGHVPSQQAEWKSLMLDQFKRYKDVDEFWKDFAADPKWYLRYTYLNGGDWLSTKALLLAKHMIVFFNDVRKKGDFTYREYDSINRWSTLVWSDQYRITEIKQWCPHCSKEVVYQARYPKYICHECFSKDKLSSRGNLLEFSNLGFSGGFQITYKDRNGNVIREDDTQEYCDCLIDGKLYFAKEAKFGGIVIQARE
jgi:hypothetical protein